MAYLALKEHGGWPRVFYLRLQMALLIGSVHTSSLLLFHPILQTEKLQCNRKSHSLYWRYKTNLYCCRVQSDCSKGHIKSLLPQFDEKGWKKLQEMVITYGKAFFCKSFNCESVEINQFAYSTRGV